MGSVRTLKGRGTLFLDFRYLGKRCREYTALADTPSNRKRLSKVLEKIEEEISAGTFDYLRYFPQGNPPTSIAPSVPPATQPGGVSPELVRTPRFDEFVNAWVAQHKVEWRRSHLKVLQSTLDSHLMPAFGMRPVGSITRSEVLEFRA